MMLETVARSIADDAVKALQIQALCLGWELYEFSLNPMEAWQDGKNWCLKVTGEKDQRLIKVFPVEDVIWRFSQTSILDLKNRPKGFIITNLELSRTYVENLKFNLMIEGCRDWSVTILFEMNQLPKLECLKL